MGLNRRGVCLLHGVSLLRGAGGGWLPFEQWLISVQQLVVRVGGYRRIGPEGMIQGGRGGQTDARPDVEDFAWGDSEFGGWVLRVGGKRIEPLDAGCG
eukprot:259813-Prorocentrum_minimum.AAC.1